MPQPDVGDLHVDGWAVLRRRKHLRAMVHTAQLYDPDQPRDEDGKWGSGGGAHWSDGGSAPTLKLTKSTERAFTGERVAIPERSILPRVGADSVSTVSESVAAAFVRDVLNLPGARTISGAGRNNRPIDVAGDHTLFEVKGGQVSNTEGAQQWRITVDYNWHKEAQAKAAAKGPEALARFRARMQDDSYKRKEAAVREASQATGREYKGKTIGVILNPQKRIADVHVFDGFHKRIDWSGDVSEAGYAGSYHY